MVVTGLARAVTDARRIAQYEQLLRLWVAATMDTVVEIEATIVTGVRLIAAANLAPRHPITPNTGPDTHGVR